MLAGVMHYKKDAASPLHLHKNCEHFYFIITGKATVESDEGVRPVGPGDMISFPPRRSIGCAPPSRCSTSSSRRPTASRPPFWKALVTTCVGNARTAKCGSRAEQQKRKTTMSLTFIDTNKLPKKPVPGQGEVTEVLNQVLCGAKNVQGSLHWLKSAETFKADAANKHQLIYVMDGKGRIRLNNRDYDVEKGGGVYLGPSETATIQRWQLVPR